MKGICFIEPLVAATVIGLKTQTRRIMNPQMPFDNMDYHDSGPFSGLWVGTSKKLIGEYPREPKYKVGEVLYLKEPYLIVAPRSICYKYGTANKADKWKNKLFMPAYAARFFIKITAVRSERLQDITDNDCIREGIAMREPSIYGLRQGGALPHISNLGQTPRKAYAALIDKINGRGTWDFNPWIWVYDYIQCDWNGNEFASVADLKEFSDN
jgi:hypothetical protein